MVSDGVVCSVCSLLNSAEANFCSACGAPLSVRSDMDTGRVPVVGVDVPGAGEVGQMIITRGASAGARFAISTELTRIGRDTRSEIFLDDITVSRNHAEVRREPDGQYSLTDLGSLNGTYLDGERITHALLREGAQVQVGKFRFVFVIGTLGGSA
ncbi:MAG TPA: FHA domain-containing protein [Microthrixaceae bacterium]|nr:FHA domain-containing protein [Microthrixaceae bacterium]